MNKRPKQTDTEDDVLQMQESFLAEKAKNPNFRPSAQVVRKDRGKKQSLFSKSRNHIECRNASKPTPESIILGDIVEKQVTAPKVPGSEEMDMDPQIDAGFPRVEKIQFTESSGGKSLFALSMERKRNQVSSSRAADDQPSAKTLKDNYGETSLLVEDTRTAKAIHEENLELIAQMKQEEILAEREKLLKSLDPGLLRFIEEKRKKQMEKCNNRPAQAGKSKTIQEIPPQPLRKPTEETMDLSDEDPTEKVGVEAVAEILKASESENWLHFDVIEKDKFDWMKDVPSQMAKLKPGETFEARFDWKGVLLPYNEPETDKDNRELYLHGDEPHRPGYTLQELFRLCRSNIIQQRISAFGAISGMLNIYNQGFYDNILDLPITKIFFLLRFGFDENSTAILEVVSRALAMLFYNQTDEVLLDLVTEAPEGYLQPILSVEQKNVGNIENVFSKMKLTSTPFSTKVDEDEDEESTTNMNDFQLAETDLIECLLRTNIVQRIYYILGIIRPENSTVESCLKILIRIARCGKDACNQIATNSELLKTLFECFLPRFENMAVQSDEQFYNSPQHLVLKLFRIMISQHISFCINLSSYGLQERIQNYLYSRQDIKNKHIKVQIESLRILRSMMLTNFGGTIYRDLLPAFRYMLDWHYQYVIYGEGGPFLIRQHASALLNAIYSGTTVDAVPILGEKIAMCSCKWFYEATKLGITEFSQSTILASSLNCISRFAAVDKSHCLDFINKYLRQFIQSKSFVDYVSNLRFLSVLLKKSNDRKNIHPPLMGVGAVISTDESPQLIVSQKYPVYILNSILNIIQTLHTSDSNLIVDLINKIEIVESFTNYLENISTHLNRQLATSFLAKAEIRFAFKLLCFKPIREIMAKEVVLQAAYNIVCCMTSEHIAEIETLFENILFDGDNLQFDGKVLSQWKGIFLDTFVYPHRIVIPATEISLSMPCSLPPLLPLDWPYLPLKTLLNKYLQQMSETIQPDPLELPESKIITITTEFTDLLERNGLTVTSPTEKLMYLMISFMGPNSEFLEPHMKEILRDAVQKFFRRSLDVDFQFNATFEGKSKFENLYVLFLDHFQAASYGDPTFSALVLVPLAQRYDNKWRKMVWSEHASVLRFLNCDENELLGGIDPLLQPIETDESLIRCYMQALNSNLLRMDTIPYKIAQHHVKHFMKQKQQK